MAKVYVSSTVADLRRERRAVVEWLVASGHQPVHSYLPNSDTVRDSCLEDVDSCDLYVLILGHRYGFQPAEDNPEGLSITHLEFRQAGRSRKPRIALLRTSIPDVSLSDLADPQRLALVSAFREEVAREVRAAEFGDREGLILGLSTGVQAGLDKLGTRPPADRGAGDRAGGLVLRLAPRPVFLAGREKLLTELAARLAGSDGAGPRVVALCGLDGAGKTSVALEYAHRQLGGVGVAWQFGGENATVLAAGFGELAVQLGAGDGGDPVAAVHGVLAASTVPWLLVFDNTPDRASVAPFVPPAGPGRVLITSRNQIWPPGQAQQVPILDPDVAAEFLVGRTGDADRPVALELASELGGLPLALEQAAAYVQASGDSLAGYLTSFRRRRPDMLGRGEPIGSGQTVATTWRLAFEDLQQAAPGATGLLRLTAFCAPEAIPLRLLLQPRPELSKQLGEVAPVLAPLLEDELAAGDAVAALRRYSLVAPAAGGSVSVHRLVQAVTADQMTADLASRWQQAAAALIEAAIPQVPSAPETWSAYAALLPHAQVALTPASGGMARLANYLGNRGNYASALELQQRIVDARERLLGADHPDTLTARSDLALWTGEAGDVAGARDQYAAVLSARESVLGPEHSDTVVTRANFARWTGEAGDAAGARDEYAAVLSLCERVFGPDDSTTLTAQGALARWTGNAGDAAGARDQLAALLPAYERVFGPEHVLTLTIRHTLASCIGEAGDPAGARDQLAALLAISTRILGPEHPDTLTTLNNLASFAGEAGDAAGARDQFAALLPIRKRVLGSEHPYTLTTQSGLARFTGEAGHASLARDQLVAVLPVFERVLGPSHPYTAAARDLLARWTEKAETNITQGVD